LKSNEIYRKLIENVRAALPIELQS
jgi:hypothetical protein